MKSFSDFQIAPSLVQALHKEGITEPTAVQTKVLPLALLGKDLVVQSETGTGKTLAYLLPIFHKIDPAKKEMQALIIAPTHELAMQILRQIGRLAENSEIKASYTAAIGNVNIERQIENLRAKPNIIVGTPGRIHELIKRKKIAAHTIVAIVIDEADTLISGDNADTIRAIIKSTPRDRQLLMFSATITKSTEQCALDIMREPEFIKDENRAAVPTTIEHLYFVADERDKVEVLRKAIAALKPQKAIIFIGDREEAGLVVEKLNYHGLMAQGLHGHVDKVDRKRAMDDFRSGKTPLLVVSDLAARGIDIAGITHIFNLNIPENPGDYLHRVGRTGRQRNRGTAVSIATPRELQYVRLYEKALNIKISAKDLYKGQVVELNSPQRSR